MSKKVKDIIYYSVMGVLVIALLVSSIVGGISGTLPLWASIVVAVSSIGILVLCGLDVYETYKIRKIEENKK